MTTVDSGRKIFEMTEQDNKLILQYWGKADDKSSAGPQWHPLAYHCLDVAAVAAVLLDSKVYDLTPIARDLGVSHEQVRALVLFFVALHDLGKFARAFQLLRPDLPIVIDAKNKRLFKRYSERHDTLGWAVWDHARGHSGLPDPIHTFWEYWLKSAVGHHGKPPKEHVASGLDANDYFLLQDMKAADDFTQAMSNFFELGKLSFPTPTNVQCEAIKAYTWQLAGLTVIADWLGSNQNFFEYHSEPMPLAEYWERIALPTAHLAVKNSGLLPNAPASALAPKALFDYLSAPTPLQQYAHEVQLLDGPQLFLLEDVTGSGKTEAALILVNRLMAAGKAQGTYIALPTMATANQMYERVGKAYRKLFAENAAPSLVLAHGARNLVADFADSVLPESPKESNTYNPEDKSDDDSPASAQCAAWLADSNKKSLLADVGVGTLDQALMAVLPVKHQALRLFGLSRKVLVVDEAHAYDPYMSHLLERVLHFHARQGGSAIILTATLPSGLRAKFTRAFQKGLLPAQEPEPLAPDVRYPLATQVAADAVHVEHCDTRPRLKRNVAIAWAHDIETVIKLICCAASEGKAVCWIRNTVTEAREAYQELKDHIPSDQLHLFHARFPMGRRLKIEDTVLDMYGKRSNAQQREGQVLIATQVVEQSLDIDFDVLISDLAPIDLLIQRAGRLHRHARMQNGDLAANEEDHRAPPVLHILAPQPNENPDADWYSALFKQGKYIYPNTGQLWLTQNALLNAKAIVTPGSVGEAAAVRTLVEAVYGENAAQIAPALLAASNKAEGKDKGVQGLASFNALDTSKPYSRESGDWDDDARIATRLGEDARLLYLAKIENGILKPLLDASRHPWAMSAVRIERRKLADLSPSWQARHNLAIEHLRKENCLFTDFDLVLPMETNGADSWHAKGVNPDGRPVQIAYDPVLGLVIT
jgi:CRISPR-associated endonuclease/helicase Cas3